MVRAWRKVQAGADEVRARRVAGAATDRPARLNLGPRRPASLLALVLALVCASGALSATRVQSSLSRAASALAGQRVVVACTHLPGLEGEADVGRVWLDLGTCAPLIRRAAAGPDNVYAAEAAAALAHEVGHVLLGACEYRAERYGMTHWRQLYQALGLGTPDSVEAAYVLAMHRELPPEYLSPVGGC